MHQNIYDILSQCGVNVCFTPQPDSVPGWDGQTLHVCHFVLVWDEDDFDHFQKNPRPTTLSVPREKLYALKQQMGVWPLVHKLAHLLIAKYPNVANYGYDLDTQTSRQSICPVLSYDDGANEESMTHILSYAISYWMGRSDESIQEEIDLDPNRRVPAT